MWTGNNYHVCVGQSMEGSIRERSVIANTRVFTRVSLTCKMLIIIIPNEQNKNSYIRIILTYNNIMMMMIMMVMMTMIVFHDRNINMTT